MEYLMTLLERISLKDLKTEKKKLKYVYVLKKYNI